MKVRNSIRNIRYAFHLIQESSKKLIWFRMMYAVMQGIYSLYSLLILKIILQFVFQEEPLSSLLMILGVLFLISLGMEYICDKLLIYWIPKEELKVSQTIELKLYQAMQSKDVQRLENPAAYNRYFFVVQNGKESILSLLVSFADIIARMITISGLVALLISTDIIILFFVFVYLLASLKVDMWCSKNHYLKNVELVPVNRRLDYINRIFYLKQYHLEMRIFPFIKLIKEKLQLWYKQKDDIQNKFHLKQVNYDFMKIFSSLMFQMCTIIYIALLALKDVILKSDFLVLYNGTFELSSNLNSLVQFLPTFYENSLYIDEIRAFLCDEIEYERVCEQIDVIELKDVSFQYLLAQTNTLHEISYRFEKGKSYAIIGMNGSGKTTLVKVLGSLYQDYQGEIIINQKVEKKSYLHQMSYIFQDYQIYAMTIAENILMHPVYEKDEQLVEMALKKVGLYEKVMGLPNGIHTEMTSEFSEESTMFSGGELQKLALCRAIVKECDILILDEPSSALDILSESEFLNLAKELGRNKILIYITHKLEKLQMFDEIICMKEGRIVESGNYEELVMKNSYLKHLIHSL